MSAEDRDRESSVPRTEREPGSATRDVRPSEASSGERRARSVGTDTLLSLPAPEARDDSAVVDRLTAAERRLDELAARVVRLEQGGTEQTATPRPWWLWLVFLAGLAAAWQIVARMR